MTIFYDNKRVKDNENQWKISNNASFLLVEIQISIDFLQTDMMKKKDTLVNLLQVF